MSTTRERLAFAVMLAQELPVIDPEIIAEMADRLMVAARNYHRLCLRTCNTPRNDQQIEDDRAQEAAIVEMVDRLVQSMKRLGARPVFDGDPRGYEIKLLLPSRRSNNLGGEGWGIPNE